MGCGESVGIWMIGGGRGKGGMFCQKKKLFGVREEELEEGKAKREHTPGGRYSKRGESCR